MRITRECFFIMYVTLGPRKLKEEIGDQPGIPLSVPPPPVKCVWSIMLGLWGLRSKPDTSETWAKVDAFPPNFLLSRDLAWTLPQRSFPKANVW